MQVSITRRRLVAPSPLPADLPVILEHMRLTDDQTAEAERFVRAAMLEVEAAAQLALFDQEVMLHLDRWGGRDWPGVPIRPAKGTLPVVLTQSGAARHLTAGDWQGDRFPWPDGLELEDAPLRLAYTAGFGTAAGDLPEDLVLAILDQALTYHDTRGDGQGGLSAHAARIVGRYRGVRL